MHSSKARPDGLGAVPQLEHSGTGFEKQRTEKKKIVATDERDIDVVAAANQSIETPRGRETANTATQHQNVLLHFLTSGCNGKAVRTNGQARASPAFPPSSAERIDRYRAPGVLVSLRH
jgi:hypothetical protein